jgi:hypothetical protein
MTCWVRVKVLVILPHQHLKPAVHKCQEVQRVGGMRRLSRRTLKAGMNRVRSQQRLQVLALLGRSQIFLRG